MHVCQKTFGYLITLREIKDGTALASQEYVWNTSCTLFKGLQYCPNTCFLFRLLLASWQMAVHVTTMLYRFAESNFLF